jgi:hypothetical protein
MIIEDWSLTKFPPGSFGVAADLYGISGTVRQDGFTIRIINSPLIRVWGREILCGGHRTYQLGSPSKEWIDYCASAGGEINPENPLCAFGIQLATNREAQDV